MEHNSYLIKAMDAYPYDLEEAVEALNYALSFEPNNGMALCLMGRIYLEVYQDYDEAISYFEKALEENLNMHTIYGYYANALICAKELNKADTFLDFALTVKGADKALLFSCKAAIQEVRRDFKKAKKFIKEAKLETYNDGFISSLEEMENRIKKKESLLKDKKKVKSTK
ncbi:MAG: tetratricopeptide repeat protein [Fluviicola sp.]